LKSNAARAIRRSLFWTFVVNAILATVLYAVLLFIFGVLLRDFTARTLRNVLGLGYYDLIDNRNLIFITSYIVLIGFLIYRAIAKSIRYLEILTESIDKVFHKDEDLVVLPDELKEIETKLNSIKYTAIRNEQIAKEAEQRKNDLVVYLAHDLKTPLTSIIGYLSLLKEAPEMPVTNRQKYTSIALDKAYRLEQLINEFFDITRFSLQAIVLEKSRINLSLMLYQMIDEFFPMFSEKKIQPVTQIENNITIYADADKLARVFDNLLRNGVSYSYEGTDLQISAVTKDGQALISFRNIGDMIPQHKLDSIFEKFFRLDTARETRTGGAGLGLAIAKQIVELHEGSISVVSNNDYTEFTVTLPLQS